ncbi:TPA: hypothetical protein DDW35_04405 [Candidatus Sumerlaeota bacterium]|jgi:ribose/xylose/arabinose/galactoside ABC-type transport system permease subunit|nr:hypothetical protein [Candidatus Sumerlaeota bacterium]
MQRFLRSILGSQQSGLVMVILGLGAILAFFAGSHEDKATGAMVNNFLNAGTLLQVATDASFFAIMAVGMTLIIVSDGIDLSIGSIYALAGVTMAMVLAALPPSVSPVMTVFIGLGISLGIGLLCGLFNGAMIVGLNVHPFIITLGTMWVFRGIAFVASKANSILVPQPLTDVAKCTLGLGKALYPVPLLTMLLITLLGAIYLSKTVMGRHIYAVGGNEDASRFCGLRVKRIRIGVFVLAGLTAGIAAFLGISYYGSASCGDAQGYELYVIASAVVGGASMSGGKGSAISAMLGAILITMIRQSIRTLHFDQNYEWIIIGCAIVIAVVLDQFNARMMQRRLANAAAQARVQQMSSAK